MLKISEKEIEPLKDGLKHIAPNLTLDSIYDKKCKNMTPQLLSTPIESTSIQQQQL